MNLLDSAIESKAQGNSEMLARMYGSFGIEGTAKAETKHAAHAPGTVSRLICRHYTASSHHDGVAKTSWVHVKHQHQPCTIHFDV